MCPSTGWCLGEAHLNTISYPRALNRSTNLPVSSVPFRPVPQITSRPSYGLFVQMGDHHFAQSENNPRSFCEQKNTYKLKISINRCLFVSHSGCICRDRNCIVQEKSRYRAKYNGSIRSLRSFKPRWRRS